MGMSGNGNMGRQTEALIQWGDNLFRFLEVPEKTPIFIFSQKICRPLKSAALGGRLMVKPPLKLPMPKKFAITVRAYMPYKLAG
jgi:hypothetical protein